MYKCRHCGLVFEEYETAFWTEPSGESWSGCPHCHGSYEELLPCEICGSYNHEDNESFCESCKEKVDTRFQNFVNSFTPAERRLINTLYDGKNI